MAARGSESKDIITKKILETFNGAFIYDKNIIIPMNESGENLQIKVALTCAKVNVEAGGDAAVPGFTVAESKLESAFPVTTESIQPTEEEKKNVANLLSMLGL